MMIIAGTVGVIGYLSFRNGLEGVNDMAAQIQHSLQARIKHDLDEFLSKPHALNRINAEALRSGLVNPRDYPGQRARFLQQIQAFASVVTCAFGSARGDFIGAGWRSDGVFDSALADKAVDNDYRVYILDERGQPAELVSVVPDYDPRSRSWYQAALNAGQPAWSPIYIWASQNNVGIGAVLPVYDGSGALMGVQLSALSLEHIGRFLSRLKIGKSGQAFIVERSGMLVASSFEPPTRLGPESQEPTAERFQAVESTSPLIRSAAGYLIERFGNFDRIAGDESMRVTLSDQNYFLNVTLFSDGRGLEWLIAVIVPESDFMAHVNANAHATLLMSILALIAAGSIGIFTARWITQPILKLNAAAQQMSQGRWQEIIVPDRFHEVGQLAASFNRMGNQLREAFGTLEDRVRERTRELAVANEHLNAEIVEHKRDEEALRESEERVRRKLESVLSPEGDLGVLELADLIDTPALQKLMDDFYAVARISMSIIDVKGRVLAGVGWQDICTRFHRVQADTCRNCLESDTRLSAGLTQGEYRLHKCRNNLWDMATPIIVAGQHVGNIFTGQFCFEDETIDRELFRAQARGYGFDEKEYLAALDRVPRLSREAVDRGMSFFLKLADTLSQLGYSNVKLARLLAERDRLTDSLRESRAKLEAALASMTDAVLISDAQGRFVDFNDAFATFHRFRDKHECSKTFAEHPDILDVFMANGEPAPLDQWVVPRALRGETVTNAEYSLRRKDTGEIWVGSYSLGPIRDKDGAIVGSVVVGRDITEHQRAKEVLRESESFYRQTLESIPGMVFTTRPDGYCDYQSQQWVDYTGIPMSEHLGDGWNRLLYQEDQARAFAAWRAAVEGRAPYDLEYRVRRHDGAYEWFKVIGRPIRNASGEIVRWFGVAMNIEDLKRAEEALRKSEAKYRNLFTNMAEEVHFWEIVRNEAGGIMTWRLVDVNPPALKTWGRSTAEEIIGKATDEIFGPGATDHYMPVVRKIMTEDVPYFFEDYFPNLDKYFRFTSVPLGDYFITTGTDITAIRKAHEALRQLNETLEQRVAERTELAEARAKQLQALAMELIEAEERERRRVAELLHDDLQQILAAARMQLQAARESLPPEPMLANVERMLEESIEKSRRLSHELSPAVLHHSGLGAALQWLAGQMRDQFGLQVQLEADSAQPFESASLKVFLFRAVQELLFNVVKHAGVRIVQVVLSGSDSSLAITVSDQGRGFNPDILDSYTATRGFGLLSLRERARYIGGRLAIESAPEQGSRFTLTVPISHAGADEVEPPAVDPQPLTQAGSPVSSGMGGIRVLFVDDHAIMRQGLIRLMAGQPNIQVVGEAANGREAIERVRQLKPDVVVMDISMPEMDGIEATRRIKSDQPFVRVIGLSMYEEEHLARSMREAGAEAFVSKTASPAELLEAIYGFDH
ncbi:MAG: PocR ligand-binding domain-containing protein [Deltaproteobacteria bacterium]|nr:PocR ligand-binding domain-containing protein [Deltaproteobacteria bacterium]